MSPDDTARRAILDAVRAVRPAAVPRPAVRDIVQSFPKSHEDRVQRFIRVARDGGATVIEGNPAVMRGASPETAVCEGVLGVAENGAVWLPGSRLKDRAKVLLAEDVVVMLDRSAIVDDMHAAYRAIDVTQDGFGMFMAGPSKTADIEQSLVIGAHGPKRLTLFLVSDA